MIVATMSLTGRSADLGQITLQGLNDWLISSELRTWWEATADLIQPWWRHTKYTPKMMVKLSDPAYPDFMVWVGRKSDRVVWEPYGEGIQIMHRNESLTPVDKELFELPAWASRPDVVDWAHGCNAGNARFSHEEIHGQVYFNHMWHLPLRVVVGVLVRDGKYLVGVRQGMFEFPGGRIESNESREQALRREWLEKTGLSIGVGRLLGSRLFPRQGRRPAHITAFEVYSFGELSPIAFDSIAWASLRELQASNLTPGTQWLTSSEP